MNIAMYNFNKEDKIIFSAIRFGLNKENGKELKKNFKNNLNWRYVLKRLEKERLACFFYKAINDAEALSFLPQDALNKLENNYYENCLRNMVILREFEKISRVFNRQDINLAPLKGLFLSAQIYKNIALRPFTDMDILIRRNDLNAINGILNSLGYASPEYFNDSLKAGFSSVNMLIYERKKEESSFIVHIHWHLVNTTWPVDSLVRKIDMAKIWASTILCGCAGQSFSALSSNHLLLYLSHHACAHNFSRFILALDIAKVLDACADSLDWDLLIGEAENICLLPQLYYSLNFTSKNFMLDIPQLKYIKEKLLNCRGRRFISMLNIKPSYKLFYFVYLSAEEGIVNKIKFIVKTFFPSRSIIARNFNIPLSEVKPGHYLMRIKNNFLRK